MLNIFSTKKWAIIKIVYGCNHRCYFCHERENIYSYNFKNIHLSDLDTIYEWIRENEFDYIIISWGEPTLHPDLVKIILYFQERDIHIVMVNNGSRLHTHDFSKVDPNKMTFYISYHGLEEEYNDITESTDFQQVSENISLISKQFPEVILRYVVNKKNTQTFHEYTRYVFENFPDVYLEYVLVEDLRYSHVQETYIPLTEFYKLVFQYIKHDKVLLDGWAACFSPYLFQHARNKFDPLVNTMLGLVKKTKQGELVYNIKQILSDENIKSHWKKCKSCVQYDYCHGFDTDYINKHSWNDSV